MDETLNIRELEEILGELEGSINAANKKLIDVATTYMSTQTADALAEMKNAYIAARDNMTQAFLTKAKMQYAMCTLYVVQRESYSRSLAGVVAILGRVGKVEEALGKTMEDANDIYNMFNPPPKEDTINMGYVQCHPEWMVPLPQDVPLYLKKPHVRQGGTEYIWYNNEVRRFDEVRGLVKPIIAQELQKEKRATPQSAIRAAQEIVKTLKKTILDTLTQMASSTDPRMRGIVAAIRKNLVIKNQPIVLPVDKVPRIPPREEMEVGRAREDRVMYMVKFVTRQDEERSHEPALMRLLQLDLAAGKWMGETLPLNKDLWQGFVTTLMASFIRVVRKEYEKQLQESPDILTQIDVTRIQNVPIQKPPPPT